MIRGIRKVLGDRHEVKAQIAGNHSSDLPVPDMRYSKHDAATSGLSVKNRLEMDPVNTVDDGLTPPRSEPEGLCPVPPVRPVHPINGVLNLGVAGIWTQNPPHMAAQQASSRAGTL